MLVQASQMDSMLMENFLFETKEKRKQWRKLQKNVIKQNKKKNKTILH